MGHLRSQLSSMRNQQFFYIKKWLKRLLSSTGILFPSKKFKRRITVLGLDMDICSVV